MPTSRTLKFLVGGLALATASWVGAQQTVPIFGLMELSGAGTTSGTNFDNGIKLAVSLHLLHSAHRPIRTAISASTEHDPRR